MTTHYDHQTPTSGPQRQGQPQHQGHGGHGWMMIACCIPMILVAIVLVATGVLSPGFLLVAVGCLAMMAMMMRGMGGMGGDDGHNH